MKFSEDGLQTIVDTIPVLAWVAHPDGSAEFFNRRWLDFTGLRFDEASGWGWKTAVHPEDVGSLLHRWRAILATGHAGEAEARLRRHDGGYRWFLFRAAPLCDDSGQVIRWCGTNTDIEDLKQAESLLAAEKHTLEMIADGAGLNEILNHLCSSMDNHVAPSMTTILLMDPDGKRLWHTAGVRVPRKWVPIISPLPVALEAGLCGTAAFLKKRVVVPNVATDPYWPDRLRPIAISNGIRAGWSEPIVTKGGQVLGTFALYSPEPRVPTDADLGLIEGAGRIALIAIERQQSQEALRSALEEIRQSEHKLRQIVDNIPGLVWTMTALGEVELVNQQMLAYFGKSLDELKAWSDFLHADDRARVVEHWQRTITTGEPYQVEHRLRRRDGCYRWFHCAGLPLRNTEGTIVRWYNLLTDIDERKQAEEKLRRSERNLLEAQRLGHSGSFSLDVKSGIVSNSPEGLRLFAPGPNEDFSTPEFFINRIHPDDRSRVRDLHERCLAEKTDYQADFRLLFPDGSIRHHHTIAHACLNETGELVEVIGTGIDTTEQMEIRIALEKALAEITRLKDGLYEENIALREEIDRSSMFEEIVGASKSLNHVLEQVARVAKTESTVLILGETGTGKELIARAIHKQSDRSSRAFIRVNCAAIPASLIASELFGHEKGAFTGALQRRVGRFESANGGTIFLDEIGELPGETQVALLRVLQEREIERLGGNHSISVDVRILAATNRDLKSALDAGIFRQDLYYRLNVFPIAMPPLRDRVDDIPVLVQYFVERYAKRAGKRIRNISKRTLKMFQGYDWPGNIRELQNVVERAVILCDRETFAVDETWLRREPKKTSEPTVSFGEAFADSRNQFVKQERAMIEAALAACSGRVSGPSGAAVRLGIARQTLDSKIRALGINKYKFKAP